MRKLALLLALSILAPTLAKAAEPSEAERIRNCRWFTKLSSSKQREAAKSTPYSAEEHRWACQSILRRNAPAPKSRPAPARPSQEQDRTPECDCSFGYVCVRRGLGWGCEYHGSSLNRCLANFDCRGPGSRCENGMCTR